MKVMRFLELVLENVLRVKRYKNGGDGTNGDCDCIGLIIGALRMGGVKWPWTHGSNYTARNRMRWMKKLERMSDLQLGQLVYKAHDPGAKGWALPDTYKGHADQRDYYHVGVVTDVNPIVITNCTGVQGGIQRDKTLDGGEWNWYGEMDLVEYGEEVALIMGKYKVINGRLNLRNGPGYQYQTLVQIPDGEIIDAADEPKAPGWLQVVYEGVSGYALGQFLEPVSAPDAPDIPAGGETVVLALDRAVAEMLLVSLMDALK